MINILLGEISCIFTNSELEEQAKKAGISIYKYMDLQCGKILPGSEVLIIQVKN